MKLSEAAVLDDLSHPEALHSGVKLSDVRQSKVITKGMVLACLGEERLIALWILEQSIIHH